MIVFSYLKFVCFRVAKTTYKTCKRGEILWTYKEQQPGLMEEKELRRNQNKPTSTEGPQRRDID